MLRIARPHFQPRLIVFLEDGLAERQLAKFAAGIVTRVRSARELESALAQSKSGDINVLVTHSNIRERTLGFLNGKEAISLDEIEALRARVEGEIVLGSCLGGSISKLSGSGDFVLLKDLLGRFEKALDAPNALEFYSALASPASPMILATDLKLPFKFDIASHLHSELQNASKSEARLSLGLIRVSDAPPPYRGPPPPKQFGGLSLRARTEAAFSQTNARYAPLLDAGVQVPAQTLSHPTLAQTPLSGDEPANESSAVPLFVGAAVVSLTGLVVVRRRRRKR